MEELNDTSTCGELDKNIDKKIKKDIVKLTKHNGNYLTNKEIPNQIR